MATLRNFVFLVVFFVIICVKNSSAISCFVCHSVNGSHPECESDLEQANQRNGQRGHHLLIDCRQQGSSDPRAPQMTSACVTVLGEYKDKRTKEHIPIISRKCSGASYPSGGSSIMCGLIDSVGHLPGDNELVNGCGEHCYDDKCNGKSAKQLGARLRTTFKTYYENIQKQAGGTKLRFPSIFAVEENQRLSSGTQQPLAVRVESNSSDRTKSVGIFAMSLPFIFWALI